MIPDPEMAHSGTGRERKNPFSELERELKNIPKHREQRDWKKKTFLLFRNRNQRLSFKEIPSQKQRKLPLKLGLIVVSLAMCKLC